MASNQLAKCQKYLYYDEVTKTYKYIELMEALKVSGSFIGHKGSGEDVVSIKRNRDKEVVPIKRRRIEN